MWRGLLTSFNPHLMNPYDTSRHNIQTTYPDSIWFYFGSQIDCPLFLFWSPSSFWASDRNRSGSRKGVRQVTEDDGSGLLMLCSSMGQIAATESQLCLLEFSFSCSHYPSQCHNSKVERMLPLSSSRERNMSIIPSEHANTSSPSSSDV